MGEADSAERAVVMARKLQPDLVLLDFLLPRKSGIDVLPEPQGYYRVHANNMYAGHGSREQIGVLLEYFEARAVLLNHHLREMGAEVEPAVWKQSRRYRKWRALFDQHEAGRP